MVQVSHQRKVIRALHAEGVKRGLDHDGLHDVCKSRFGLDSMAELNLQQAKALFRDLTGADFARPRVTLPKRGYGRRGVLEMVTPAHMEVLGRAFSERGWGPETRRAFIARQLQGREEIRTVADF